MDEIIELCKKDVDRTLLRENLKLTPEQRAIQLMELLKTAEEFQRAGRALAKKNDPSSDATQTDALQDFCGPLSRNAARGIPKLWTVESFS